MIKLPIIWMELRRSFVSFIIWTVSICAMLVFVIVLYPMVKDMYAAIPAEFMDMLDAFGGIPDSIMEYYATEGGMMMQLLASIYVIFLGFNAIGKEEREHSSDIIYSLPVSRSSFFIHKWLAVCIQVTLFSILLYVVNIVTLSLVESIPIGQFTLFSVLFTVMLYVIAAFGFALGAIVKASVKAMSTLLVIFPMYIFSFISTLTNNEWLQKIKYLSVFTFADPVNLLKVDKTIDWISLTVFVLLAFISMGFTYFTFSKREFID
ncbi:MAG: ABC transporter permease subunit [Bacilli bacterium]|nr:ABC transporter permease subunit [Bacilli bacterium]